MTENNAAQPGPTDGALMDLEKQVQRDIPRFGPNVHIGVRAGVLRAMLSKLRADGVQAGDERVRAALAALLGQWDKYKSSEYQNQEDAYNRLDKYARPLWQEARAALASAPVAVPDGWRLVPIDPTEEMRQAGAQYAECGISANAVFGYRAMLAAAPGESAPAAGEAIAWREVDNVGRAMTCWIDGNPGDNPVPSQKYFSIQRAYAAPQVSLQCGSCGYTADPECATCSPAPQASEAVRNAALEEAAKAMENTGKRIAAADIRSLKRPART